MGKAKLIILLFILIAAILGYSIGKQSTRVSTPNNAAQLKLPYEQVKVSGINGAQQKQIEVFISKFYEYQQQRDVDKLLALFTPPANKQEQDDLDYLLDAQKNNYTLGGHYIRAIARHNDTTTVLVDEMRIMYSGGEYVGYIAENSKLVIELNRQDDNYKITHYYPLMTASIQDKKYKGFLNSN